MFDALSFIAQSSILSFACVCSFVIWLNGKERCDEAYGRQSVALHRLRQMGNSPGFVAQREKAAAPRAVQIAAVVESWKPIVTNAINEWAKQRALASVLEAQARISAPPEEPQVPKVETTQEELNAFATAQRLLGSERPIAYEDTVSYLKMHLQERRTAVFCRLLANRKKPCIWVPLPADRVTSLAASLPVTVPQLGWSCITMESIDDLGKLGELLRTAHEHVRSALRGKAAEPSDGGGTAV